ncbi:DUF3106 domain-containing protein [Rickettsia prowazekii]|uniref:Uncharacterized protein RP144 n=2 Tax=Rickettsia prowazekii TaxID=782 RepID=Y144_RICPR|nr:DUF3106 domain-containing protein [Rickettsia prowazekii]Q9ZE18.1 RecName: Full=Uncharacterized protein RP144 [Rickettsia prowazekii str. Madrid E]ADE29654.1 hypothetical protein rpr22_CDS137 [Rickettsia prowazekii str. Rp22]AFE48967.1 hypothetical protein M9W_00690 [Rickettsia prowazekii str. Chernikova]AFE49812.1 hypothetical protein M9Y_00690 [Rickettsia prowazekii str. Katsinyian]AFE50656.1 hypothetical protein MA1_00690 [Rickettsia prowazekii str. BuV67-CWPP]AFE51497.1 hypothetical pr
MSNVAENISKLPEEQEKINKLVDQYKNLMPQEQKEVDKKLKLYFTKDELEQDELKSRMNKIRSNLSQQEQEKLQAGNSTIGEIAKDVLSLVKGIINLVENISKVIKNPTGAVYEWFQNELNQVKPQQQNNHQLQSKPKAASISR